MLRDSRATQSGLLSDLEECELFVRGIGPDMVSDITTNIVRRNLVHYTQAQCELYGIQTTQVPFGPFWNPANLRWNNEYTRLPIINGRPILLVPKAFVRGPYSSASTNPSRRGAGSYLSSFRNGPTRIYFLPRLNLPSTGAGNSRGAEAHRHLLRQRGECGLLLRATNQSRYQRDLRTRRMQELWRRSRQPRIGPVGGTILTTQRSFGIFYGSPIGR